MIHKTKTDIRKQSDKTIRKSQIVNTEVGIMKINYTLKQMLGLPINVQEGNKGSSGMSTMMSGKIGDLTINTAQLKDEFENKYL